MLNRIRSGDSRLRLLWLLACAAALLLRAAVPAGWMPVADANGVHISLCGGSEAMAAAHAAMADRMGHKAPAKPAPDHPCAFAAFGFALTAPPPIAPLLVPVTVSAAPSARVTAITVGRGLAAPPPPATGPPAFA